MKKTIQFGILLFAFCIFLTACGDKKCEQHVYDDCADIECNECGEKRDSTHTWVDANCTTPKICQVCGLADGSALGHDYAAANCTTPKTCKVCGLTDGSALGHDFADADCTTPKTCKACGATDGNALGHKPAEDDGDCTTEVKCTVCGAVTTPAKTEHIAHADDGDCTTPVTCTECTTVLTAAKSHDFTGEWQSNETQHWHVCKNEGCNVTDEKVDHTSGGAATETVPEKCTVCEYVIAPELEHTHNYNTRKFDETNHWDECRCGDKKNETPHSAISDNNCTTDDKCDCGYTVTAAKDHVAGEDDGNCTTAIKCKNCEQNAASGTTEHTDSDHDYTCDNPGCQVSVNPPKDKNPGIDLPIDRN